MIDRLVKMLMIAPHLGMGHHIEIAKGKHQLHTKTKALYKQAMRELYIKRAEKQWKKE